MIIAVHNRFLSEGQPGDDEHFIFECLNRLPQKYPNHQFLYIFDKPSPANLVFSENVTTIISGPETTNTLLWQYWYNYKLPALLRKHKAHVLLSMNGICSLRTKLPQCLLVRDLAYLQYPQFFKKAQVRFLKKSMPSFLAKAKTIVTVSEFSRSVIRDRFQIDTDKIEVVYYGCDENFKPATPEEKEIIKEKYTEGKEYFLTPGNAGYGNNLIDLLKAFSFFKKRQKSNMVLVITGSPGEEFTKQLKTFKFRNEVRVLENLPGEELAKITAAAYAMVYPVLYADLAMAPLDAMRSEVPVVTSHTGALPELCGHAALYSDPEDFKDIAENMMLVFKDEDRAKELVKAGKIQARSYQWDKTVDLLWRSVLKSINN